MVFTGTYEHTIDTKNRLAIPAELRAVMQVERDRAMHGGRSNEGTADGAAEADPLVVYLSLGEGGALCIYTEAAFEKRAEELDHSELDPGELLAYEQLMYSLSRRLELDKQGRIRLPDDLFQQAGLNNEVVLIGVKDHIEVRDRQTWKEHVQSILRTQPGILMNPRRAMKRR